MLHSVKKVEYLEGYKLRLHFKNGKVKIIDFEERLKRAKDMFLPLVDIDYFKKVICDGDTICWPNGVDLCPDVLYKMGKSVVQRRPGKRKKNIGPIGIRRKSRAKIA